MSETSKQPDWRNEGVRIVRGDELDPNTPQTSGMTRAAAIDHARAGSQKLWAGTVRVDPDAKTGPHHQVSSGFEPKPGTARGAKTDK